MDRCLPRPPIGATGGSIHALYRALDQGRRPAASIVIAALKECARARDLHTGQRIHAAISPFGLDVANSYVANTLLAMYAKCGSLDEARRVFDRMDCRSAVSWNAMMLGLINSGQGSAALDLFVRMDLAPGLVTFVVAIKACSSIAAASSDGGGDGRSARARCLEKGREIYRRAERAGHGSSGVLAGALLVMYARCGSLIEAREVFDEISSPGSRIELDVVHWNSIILGYVEDRQGKAALRLFSRMQHDGFFPDKVTFLAAIKACGSDRNLRLGRSIHSMVSAGGLAHDVIVANALISMYSHCGSVREARLVFDSILSPTTVSWNSIIAAYAECGDGVAALELLSQMEERDRDGVTYLAAIKACSSPDLLDRGREIHARVAGRGFHRDRFVANALLAMYARCGSMPDAQALFDAMRDPCLVAWNSLILGYAQSGGWATALDLFSRLDRIAIAADSVTILAAIKACCNMAAEEHGRVIEGSLVKLQSLGIAREIHRRAARFDRELAVANSLVAMYARCGSMADARAVFDRIAPRDRSAVSWTALMAGYNDAGEPARAFQCLDFMGDCAPDGLCFVAALKACGSLGWIEAGRKIHAKYDRSGLGERDDRAIVGNALVDFYGKCGSMEEAGAVFESLGRWRDVVTWNSLMAGYARAGDFQHVFATIKRMEEESRVHPDASTVLIVLSVCCRVGLVERGRAVFLAARSSYGVELGLEHYTCMVDLLGRSNSLEEAVGLIRSMPWEESAKIWMTLLSACVKWKNLSIGKVAFEAVINIDRKNAAAHVLMANMYDSCG